MSFERFMEMALYEPGLGYYSAGSRKLGADGDFVTAPEISSLFSRCLATQCAEVLAALGGGDILELGAGSGVMARTCWPNYASSGAFRPVPDPRGQCGPARAAAGDLGGEGSRPRRPGDVARRRAGTVCRRHPRQRSAGCVAVQRFRIRGPHVNTLGVSWQLGRLDWSEIRASVRSRRPCAASN